LLYSSPANFPPSETLELLIPSFKIVSPWINSDINYKLILLRDISGVSLREFKSILGR
jgi:hypothetical protein